MTPSQPPTMSQKIFDQGLSMVTVSLYLLCCGLADADVVLTTQNIRLRWNGSESELQDGLRSLVDKGILEQILSDQDRIGVYRLLPADRWLPE